MLLNVGLEFQFGGNVFFLLEPLRFVNPRLPKKNRDLWSFYFHLLIVMLA